MEDDLKTTQQDAQLKAEKKTPATNQLPQEPSLY